ncbi:hypothetical protein [Mycolicibacterium komossense]
MQIDGGVTARVEAIEKFRKKLNEATVGGTLGNVSTGEKVTGAQRTLR